MTTAPLSRLPVPADVNYVGVFLTFRCNLDCSYCINDPVQQGNRGALVHRGCSEMSPQQWAAALGRLDLPADLPLTLQGGEPTLYDHGRGLGEILAAVDARFDLLTNLALPPERMALCLGASANKLRREAPYPSIRVSYHPAEMNRVWGEGITTLIERYERLAELGFAVTGDKRTSDVGIYMVDHPDNAATFRQARAAAEGRVAFEAKEFLGTHDGQLYGTYKYPFSTNLLAGGIFDRPLPCECRTSELLIDPLGFIWPCHFYLYETWTRTPPIAAFRAMTEAGFVMDGALADAMPFRPVGHILDPGLSLADIRRFHPCTSYGQCIGCDTKVKNDRFQSLEDLGQAHTSVDIRAIAMPEAVLSQVDATMRQRLVTAGILAAPEER